MSRQLQIGNKVFNYPDTGDNPGWGEDATAWAQAVTTALETVQGTNDIPATTTALANNVAVETPIAGLSFNLVQVRRTTIQYVVVRVFDAGIPTPWIR